MKTYVQEFGDTWFPRRLARNNRRGIARQIIGENGVRHFIDCVRNVREQYPLLWSGYKRNRRTEFYYWISVW